MFYVYTYIFLLCANLCTVCTASSTARSPLYSHFSTTLLGLTTVRACEMESVSLAYFHAYQDEQTRGWSVYLMTARWLAVRVDFIIGVFIAVLALSSIPLASSECGRTCEAHHVRHRFMGHVLSVHMPYISIYSIYMYTARIYYICHTYVCISIYTTSIYYICGSICVVSGSIYACPVW